MTNRTPLVRGLPVVGSALRMAKDPARFFVDCYREHGPVFRIDVLGKRYAVIAGAEAADFMGTAEGRDSLRSKEFWQGLVDEYGATRTLTGEDGQSHKDLREVMRRGYSRDAIVNRLDEVVAIVDRNVDRTWQPGARVPVLGAMQYLVTDQLGELMTGRSRPEYVPDIRLVTLYILNVLVTKQRPRILLRDPRYRRAKSRIAELADKILADHDAGEAGEAILVGDVIRAHRERPAVMPTEDLVLSLTGPYVAGLDTVANTITAFVYLVLKHPDVHEQVKAEADALFANGDTVTEKDLRGLRVIHGALMETMRLWPIAVAQMRTATKDFEFAGHRIAKDETLYIGTSVPHFMDEYYPSPETFDISRYEKPRSEHLQPGAYSPYGRGQHVCLGKTLADIQMLITMARLFHRVDMSLESPDYVLARKTAPTPGPATSFTIKVNGLRSGTPR